MIRLAHISDIHVRAAKPHWRARDLLSKRVTGFLNSRIGKRASGFRLADRVLKALMDDLALQAIDHIVFTGDASTLGFAEEMRHAAELLGVDRNAKGIAVPGNHDLYTRSSAAQQHFEKYFATWQQGERVDGAFYPFAQKIQSLWLIAVNSARGNLWPWDASGWVGQEQCKRLATLLQRLEGGPRILVTHYPVASPCDLPQGRFHGLQDMARVVDVASKGGTSLWLHGHCHLPYHLTRSSLAPFPIICAGSSTQAGLASYGVYTITGHRLDAARRAYEPASEQFTQVETFRLQLPTSA